uniref:C-factor n=2 Tax=Arion vulgaris TaxID=1028688 RepID=A0A0B7A6D8_9EUPU
MPITARTILITGASRGLGLEFVRQILKLETPPEVVIACCRNPETAHDLQVIAKSNPSVKIVKLDIENDVDIEKAFQETKTAVGTHGLNLLISNAGIGDITTAGLQEQTREKLQKHFDVNVSGPLILVQKFLPLIKQAASQHKSQILRCSRAGIVLVSSRLGSQTVAYEEGRRLMYDYCSSKTALNMSAILLARELKESGIYVTALHPGWARTDMGTDTAPISKEESIGGSLKALGDAGEESHGKILTFEGNILPY